MTTVSTPCRLHFGLLGVADAPAVPRFGGCGLMVRHPRVTVSVEPAGRWLGEGPSADRAVTAARAAAPDGPAFRVVVQECPPEHTGLGVGTQLSLAAFAAVCRATGRPLPAVADAAARLGRGRRSGIGTRGFAAGGFLSEPARLPPFDRPGPVARLVLPADWRLVLARPRQPGRWHGDAERAAFAVPTSAAAARHHYDAMRRLASAVEANAAAGDFSAFAASLAEFNRTAGRPFASAQGGVYADPQTAAVVAAADRLGGSGSGQSSWGPTVYSLAPDADAGERLAARLAAAFPQLDVTATQTDDTGAVCDGAEVCPVGR